MAFLDKAFGIGSDKLLAPQANVFSAMSKGLFVTGETVPWDMVGIGIVLALGLVLMDVWLRRRGASFGVSPMGLAVGVYLPFTTTLPILLGGLVHLALTLRSRHGEHRLTDWIQRGTVIAAGLVAGEALTGIALAVPVGIGVAIPWPLVHSAGVREILSLVVLLMMPVLLYFASLTRRHDAHNT
jgi:putative OPT family oligopeptide transporter